MLSHFEIKGLYPILNKICSVLHLHTSGIKSAWSRGNICITGRHPFLRMYLCWGSQDSLLLRAPDLWSKGCEFKSEQKGRENFLVQSQLCVLILTQCPFHPCVTALACKRCQPSCQKCRWQVTPKHTYTHDPTKSEQDDYATVQA